MTSTMIQRFAVAAVAVAGALATLGAGTAIAGKTASGGSPFAGDYTGPAYEYWPIDWGSISISSSGKITGTDPQWTGTGRFTGTVAADGTYALSGSVKSPGKPGAWISDVLPRGIEFAAPDVSDSALATTWAFQSSGLLQLGSDGHLLGTTTSGATFVWTRK